MSETDLSDFPCPDLVRPGTHLRGKLPTQESENRSVHTADQWQVGRVTLPLFTDPAPASP